MAKPEAERRARRIRNASNYHYDAMEWADKGDSAKRQGLPNEAKDFYRYAFRDESRAAELVAPYLDLEPTRSVLHRSAASLAMQCGEPAEAASLIEVGLAGNPPAEIADELRELRGSLKVTETEPNQ